MENKMQDLGNQWGIFVEWKSYQQKESRFLNNLREFLYVRKFNDFREFLNALVEDGYELEVNIDTALEDEDEFNFLKRHFDTFVNLDNISLADVDRQLISISPKDVLEPIELVALVEELDTDEKIIAFVNEALVQYGQVTHSSGLKPQYEFTSFDS